MFVVNISSIVNLLIIDIEICKVELFCLLIII